MDVKELVREKYRYMVACRRHLHANPELSAQEEDTLNYIKTELNMNGIEWVYIPRGGILGFINKEKEGPTVLLRADIDALQIEESKTNLKGEKICISDRPGLSHACGHDAHTAMLLAEAEILNNMRELLPGKVVVCFEQGEEGLGCLANILRYLEGENGVDVDTCYATHVRWDLPTGMISVPKGPSMSGVIGFRGKIVGQGGHGSRPDMANSPIDCFTAIYEELNRIRLRKINPYHYLTFSIGTLHSGTRDNVIPEDLTFEGTIRFFDIPDGDIFWNEFDKIVKSECEIHGCEGSLEMFTRYLPVVSNDTCCQICEKAVRRHIGDEAYTSMEPWMASESIAAMLALYPGVHTFTGIYNPEVGSGANHHTPEFDLDEDGMIYGAAAAIGYVLEYFEAQPEITFKQEYPDVEELIRICCWK
ncbi:MAG: amidohydrolase [Lachnospiraceae bacterium]|nr:amidohydrolase [Lachnospiraceae bacterium]